MCIYCWSWYSTIFTMTTWTMYMLMWQAGTATNNNIKHADFLEIFFLPLYISHHKTKTWQETRYEYVHIWCTLLFVSPYVEWSFSRRFHRARLFSVVVSVITRLSWKKWKKTKRISRNGQVRMSRIGSVKNMGKMWLRNLKVSKLTCRVKLESIVFSCRWQLRIRDLAVTPK